MIHILLVEDHDVIRNGIQTYLAEYSYSVDAYSLLRDIDEINLSDYDLAVLDINLPDGTSFQLVQRLKEAKIPIIFLTVRDRDEDIIQGLDMGADDYITKPFNPNILRARIETVLRRYKDQHESILSIGEMTLDTNATSLSIHGRPVHITAKEYELLLLFLKNRGKTISRDYLMENFWDEYGSFVNDNTLSVSIGRLREKLGPYGNCLQTIRGIGYRFDYEE